jgi:hypothetical protein
MSYNDGKHDWLWTAAVWLGIGVLTLLTIMVSNS